MSTHERERERERPPLLLNRVIDSEYRALNRELNRASKDVIENFLIYKKTQLTQLSSIV